MQLSETERKELWAKGFNDPAWFLATFLSHWFPTEMPWVHLGIIAILTRKTEFLWNYKEHIPAIVQHFVWREDPFDDKSAAHPMFELVGDKLILTISQKTIIMLPRGFSKTTLLNGVTIWKALYLECNFAVKISESGPEAEKQLRNVKGEFETNAKIIEVFGEMKPDQRTGRKWAEDEIEATNGFIMASKGSGAQIRGMNIRGFRPDDITLDDVEDKESISTSVQRKKKLDWYLGDVVPALPRIDEEGRSSITLLGTLLSGDAMLAKLAKDPEYNTVIFGASYFDGVREVPLWPRAMSMAKIAAERASFARKGKLHLFYLEYYNRVFGGEQQVFKPEHILVPKPFDPNEYYKRALAWDPAFSNAEDADYAGQAVVGMRDKYPHYALLTINLWQGKPSDQQIDNYFNLFRTFRPRYCGVEANAQQVGYIHIMRGEMFKRKLYFEIKEIRHNSKDNKIARVEAILPPLYIAGDLVHASDIGDFLIYNGMLGDWPSGKKDGPDVAAMAIALLDPMAAMRAGEGQDLAKDEYEPLDDVFDGEWRAV